MELHPPDPLLADDVVRLRAWREDDVAAITAACQDRETARWTTVPQPYTEAHAREWVQAMKRGWSSGTASFAVTTADSDAVVAAMTMWSLPRAVAEFGYWTLPSARGKGYASRALRLVAGWALEQGFARLQLGTYPGNRSSERVAEKVGFKREGVLRSWHEQRGVRRDVTMWSLLPAELSELVLNQH